MKIYLKIDYMNTQQNMDTIRLSSKIRETIIAAYNAGITPNEVKTTLKGFLNSSLVSRDTPEYINDTNTPENKKLYNFMNKMVEDTIKFINDNPDIQKLIATEDYQDITVDFHIDGLESSLPVNKWHPGSDGYMNLIVNNKVLLSIM